MKLFSGSILSIAVVLAAVSAEAQTRYIGPDVGVFYPNSSTLRNALGENWVSIGATTMRSDAGSRNGIGTNWNVISKNSGGNSVFMGSYSLGLFQPLSDMSGTRPYVAVRGGLSYIDYAIGPDTARIAGKRFGYNANAELGIIFSGRLTLSARYDVFSEHDGLNFDGLTFSLSYGIASF